jgi:hypothetical protein
MIQVMNVRGKRLKEPWDVYIGRANLAYGLKESPLANPFPVKVSREVAIEAYDRWFNNQLGREGPVLVELDRLYDLWQEHGMLSLYCWCAPLACHGNVIRSYLLDRKAEERRDDEPYQA